MWAAAEEPPLSQELAFSAERREPLAVQPIAPGSSTRSAPFPHSRDSPAHASNTSRSSASALSSSALQHGAQPTQQALAIQQRETGPKSKSACPHALGAPV